MELLSDVAHFVHGLLQFSDLLVVRAGGPCSDLSVFSFSDVNLLTEEFCCCVF